MNILILTVSTGGGHNTAALAIKEYIHIYNPDAKVEILQALSYVNPSINTITVKGYSSMVNLAPPLFGKLYYLAERESMINHLVSSVNKQQCRKFLPLINKIKPDVIVCTHPFATEMMSNLRLSGELKLPVVSLLTDYAPHKCWINKGVDAYIVSGVHMINHMVKRGVPKEKVFPLGIPISPNFWREDDKIKLRKEFGLEANKTTILLMGGSMGIKHMYDMYRKIISTNSAIQLIVVCGNNKKLYHKLMLEDKPLDKRVIIIGYTKEIYRYMHASDIIITKPGGLSLTEAISCKLPILSFSPIPGQEMENEEFIKLVDIGIPLSYDDNSVKTLESILNSPELIQHMVENCKKVATPNCGRDIYRLLEKLTKKDLPAESAAFDSAFDSSFDSEKDAEIIKKKYIGKESNVESKLL